MQSVMAQTYVSIEPVCSVAAEMLQHAYPESKPTHPVLTLTALRLRTIFLKG